MTQPGRAIHGATVADPSHWRESTVGALLAEAVDRWPDRAAVQWPTPKGLASLTWREVWHRATAGAATLISAVDHPAPVAIYSPNSQGWYLSLWAAALSGRPLVPVNPALTGTELRGILADSSATTVLAAQEYRGRNLLDVVAALDIPGLRLCDVDRWTSGNTEESSHNAAVAPRDTFVIQYTSGTTGTPKGAVLSHRACVNAANTMVPAWEPSGHEIYCSPLPLHHISALAAHALALACIGGTYVMLNGFSASQLIDAAARSGATALAGVPTTYWQLLERPRLAEALPDVKLLMVGGTSIPPRLVSRLEQHFGARASVMYGQSEAPAITATRLDDSAAVKSITVGQALPHRELCIVDVATGMPVSVGRVGEIWVRTPIRMDRYLNRPEATSATIDGEGWLHTGDLGSLDADGRLSFRGRLREMIVRGGENIYPREVEAVIETHPDVAQAAVVGLPDPGWGEIVAAAVVPRAGTTLAVEDMSAWVTQRLAQYKRPARWHFVDELPTTVSGKTQKFKIVNTLASNDAT